MLSVFCTTRAALITYLKDNNFLPGATKSDLVLEPPIFSFFFFFHRTDTFPIKHKVDKCLTTFWQLFHNFYTIFRVPPGLGTTNLLLPPLLPLTVSEFSAFATMSVLFQIIQIIQVYKLFDNFLTTFDIFLSFFLLLLIIPQTMTNVRQRRMTIFVIHLCL
jgi:hypothetical protein